MEYCDQHMQTIKDAETTKQVVIRLEKSFEDIKARMVVHINEGEKEGGFRDRVRDLEKENERIIKDNEKMNTVISSLKKADWKRVITAGIIGGIVSRSPDVWGFLLTLLR